jgi:hypothetical protein
MPPNWQGVLTFELEDPAGKTMAPYGRDPRPFEAGVSGIAWIYFPFSSDPQHFSAGMWKAKIKVPGLGDSEQSFAIDPPTEREKAALADHEEAKRHALKAFSTFWVVFPHKDLRNTFITATNGEKPTGEVQGGFNLFQVAQLKYTCTQNRLNDADRLNGISYQGEVGFGFSLYRSYSPQKKWAEWKDLNSSENVIQAGLKKVWEEDYADPERLQQAPGMRFHVQKRDGNWIVTSKENARFINGIRNDDPAIIAEKRRIEEEADKKKTAARQQRLALKELLTIPPSYPGAPPLDVLSGLEEFEETEPADQDHTWEGLIFSGEIFQPSLAIVSHLVDETATKRADLKSLASELSLSPETSKQQQEATMAALQE